jgi:enoyl-CoA hydratase
VSDAAPIPKLLVDIRPPVALLTLNRPQVRNALDDELRAALDNSVTELDAHPDVAAIVLTGADPAFCAGLDLVQLSAQRSDAPPAAAPTGRGPLPAHTKPIVGAINGSCVTGGLELALACDFLIASPNARFADTHSRVGILPGWGLTVLLPRAIGEWRARQMSLTGNYVDAATALTWGLVNEVVAHDELVPRALALATDIAAAPQATIAAYRAMYEQVGDIARGEGWARESEISAGWMRNGFDRDALVTSRERITARGRSQLDGLGNDSPSLR